MKGIILAGGSGTRLFPSTLAVSKQLLPVYDKPMIYYPMSMLMLANIRDILIISTPKDIDSFKKLFGDGRGFGTNISYAVQPQPLGLAQAFLIGEKFIGDQPVAMILGDNIFYGSGIRQLLNDAVSKANDGFATVFGYSVKDPERFGVAEFDSNKNVVSIVEKPKHPKSNYAVTGMYFFDNRVVSFAKNVKPSKRGELEIVDVINQYLSSKALKIHLLGRGFAWFDAGTHDSLAEATQFVRTVEQHQGMQLSCLEEIAFINGWITKSQVLEQANKMGSSSYGDHLKNVAEGKILY
jgi:glucose-1-phosphate thymidylyltransferase